MYLCLIFYVDKLCKRYKTNKDAYRFCVVVGGLNIGMHAKAKLFLLRQCEVALRLLLEITV